MWKGSKDVNQTCQYCSPDLCILQYSNLHYYGFSSSTTNTKNIWYFQSGWKAEYVWQIDQLILIFKAHSLTSNDSDWATVRTFLSDSFVCFNLISFHSGCKNIKKTFCQNRDLDNLFTAEWGYRSISFQGWWLFQNEILFVHIHSLYFVIAAI